MRTLATAIFAGLMVMITSTISTAWAAVCPTACSTGSCPQPGDCAGNMCWCKNGACGGGTAGPCGGGSNPSGPRDPFVPVLPTSFVVSATFSSADFEDTMGLFQGAAGWTIQVSSGTNFTSITGSWSNTSWYAIVGDIVNDQGLCMSTNTSTHVITISNC